jgi:hypothetical protein
MKYELFWCGVAAAFALWCYPPALYLGLAAGAVYFVVGACLLKRDEKTREIVRDELRK